jgi:hypothetical protein
LWCTLSWVTTPRTNTNQQAALSTLHGGDTVLLGQTITTQPPATASPGSTAGGTSLGQDRTGCEAPQGSLANRGNWAGETETTVGSSPLAQFDCAGQVERNWNAA